MDLPSKIHICCSELMTYLKACVELYSLPYWINFLAITNFRWRNNPKKKQHSSLTVSCLSIMFSHFGMHNAPSTFQRLMEYVLREELWSICLIYIDDILIFSKSFKVHLGYLAQVFKKMKGANLKLKAGKCNFANEHAKVLGMLPQETCISVTEIKSLRRYYFVISRFFPAVFIVHRRQC